MEERIEEKKRKKKGKWSIAMISDFFYPNMGGVELHIYQLAQCLIKLGNKVIIVTHYYGDRRGIRYFDGGLKVYYLPILPIYNQSTFPSFLFQFPLTRQILIRENVDLVHCHQAFSTMAHESMLTSRIMGYKTCFTDHSLFGFSDGSSIAMNKILKFTLCDINHVICVSNTSKENTVLRGALDPRMVSVIPNAVDSSLFEPNPSARDPNKITIVVLSRLVYRKGIDLLIPVIPVICKRFPNVHFLIGGDGPKRLALDEMREKHQIQDQVEFLGAINHSQVRNTLVRGNIFINCSLTEAFCTAIIEAANCGLMVVSTRVGGVPEVLPPHLIKLCEATSDGLLEKLLEAVPEASKVDPWKVHNEVKNMYRWMDVAKRTEVVYSMMREMKHQPLIDRLKKYQGCGPYAGKLFCLFIGMLYLWWRFLEYISPEDSIERADDFPCHSFESFQKHSNKR